jgi:monooxygenase
MAAVCDVDVVIVGAGLSGIACARELHLQGVSVRVFELAAKLGGTWQSTRFPGIRADSLHIQNLFSWHPVPSDSITTGPWLQSYLEECAEASGVAGEIRFHTRVESAEWDSAASVWRVRSSSTSGGAAGLTTARFVVSCNGYFDLQRPHVPAQLAGAAARFSGRVVHSAEMCAADAEALAGKRLVVVGSGATATTLVPELLRRSSALTWVFRTPAHTVPLFRLPGPWHALHNWLIRLHQRGAAKGPALRRLYQGPYQVYRFVFLSFIQMWMQVMVNYLTLVFRSDWVARLIYRVWNGTGAEQVARFFDPPYPFGHQRICLFDDLAATMRDPRLRVVKGEVSSASAREVRVADANDGGREVALDDVDALVLCTGYDLSYFKFDVVVDGVKLSMADQVLRREMMFERVPNLFFIALFSRLAPRTTTSGTPGLEVQCRQIARIVRHVDGAPGRRSFCVRPVQDESKISRLMPMTSRYITRNADKCFRGIQEESDDACQWWHMFWERPFNASDYVLQ